MDQISREGYRVDARTSPIAATFQLVFGWMTAGLALSGLVAWKTYSSGAWVSFAQGPGMWACLIGSLALVFVLNLAINKMPVALASFVFLCYAALNGLTFSVIFAAYDIALIQRVFFITAGMFGGLLVWGLLTKDDLSSVGSVCFMALWGLILATIVNIFLKSSGLDWICSIAGILIFSGLTMYDAQKIKRIAAMEGQLDAVTIRRAGIIGALQLYLDFINLFLYILRFLDDRRR